MNGLLLLVLRIKLWNCLICGRSILRCTSLILTSKILIRFSIIAVFVLIFSSYWSGLLFFGPTGRRFSRLAGIQRMRLSWLLVVWVGDSWCGILAGICLIKALSSLMFLVDLLLFVVLKFVMVVSVKNSSVKFFIHLGELGSLCRLNNSSLFPAN